jgi:uncharacterized protein
MYAAWYDVIVNFWSRIQPDWGAWGHGSLSVVVWGVTLSLLLVGLVGTFLPALPGPVMIFLGAVFHVTASTYALKNPDAGMHWVGFSVLTVLLALAIFVDFASSVVGAKYFGATKWGSIGALVGGILGLFFSLPGLILGPIIGALSFEMMFAKREWKPAAKSSWGTLLGTGVGLIVKGALGVAMVLYFLIDVLLIDRW